MKIAVVTGASSGLGRAFAIQLARSDKIDEIWAVARQKERLTALSKNLGGKVRIFSLDLLQESSFTTLREVLCREKPEIKVLVNAAGFGKFGAFNDLSPQEEKDMLDLNCKALMGMTRICLPHMKRGGKIINMGSSSAFQPLPYFSVYAATKSFVVSFSRALNMELKKRGISVTAVCPGYVKTNFIHYAQQTRKPAACTHFWPLYEPSDIVRAALRDSCKKKDMSIPGILFKAVYAATKILPAKAVMRVWLLIK